MWKQEEKAVITLPGSGGGAYDQSQGLRELLPSLGMFSPHPSLPRSIWLASVIAGDES